MAMAITLRDYLKDLDVDYQVLPHDYEVTSSRIAQQAQIKGDQLAKAVLLKCDSGYRLAVVPSTAQVDLGKLSQMLHERLGLAGEDEIEACFEDCETGAMPPLGAAYGVEVCLDDNLSRQHDIYFEAGDHQNLVHMSGTVFSTLMADAPHGDISRHM